MSAILSRPQCVNSLQPGDAYMPEKWVMIGSDNGMLPVQRQAIIWTNVDFLALELEETLYEIWINVH